MFLSRFSLKRIYAHSRTIYRLKNTIPDQKKNCGALPWTSHVIWRPMRSFGGKGWLNQSISDKAVRRTAPATPGLLNIQLYNFFQKHCQLSLNAQSLGIIWSPQKEHHYNIEICPLYQRNYTPTLNAQSLGSISLAMIISLSKNQELDKKSLNKKIKTFRTGS